MFSDEHLMKIQEVADALTRKVVLLIHQTSNDNAFQVNLLNAARQITGVSMEKIGLEQNDTPPFPDLPSLTVSNESSANIHYLAAPDGREFEPFLDALMLLGGAKEISAPSLDEKPTEMKLMIAEACPHCAQVVRSAIALAAKNPFLQLSIMDALELTDLSERYKVKSTPTIIVNDGLTIVGGISIDELAAKINDTSSLTDILESMINSGRAEEAGELMVESRNPKAILPIYSAPEFARRIGALVAMDRALELHPRSLDSIVEDLIPLLSHEETAVRGDTAELLGKIGDPRAVPALKNAAQDQDEDVKEAAEEALQALASS